MKRPFLLAVLLIGLALFLWLVITAARPLLAWQWWMIPSGDRQGAPAACEAAGFLNERGVSRLTLLDSSAYSAEAASGDIQTALAGAFPNITPVLLSDLLRVNVTDDGHSYQWLQTAFLTRSALADQPGVNQPGMAAMVLAGEGLDPKVIVAAGAGIPELTCAFAWRGWAVDTIRSLPFLIFAGYLVIGIGAASGYALYRFVRRRKAAHA
ncbi:MAG: hypothetical protein IAE89_00380 [Anaerolineae bacterium]|nr:hypothetical protein [Anaerolineae bacterium]